MSYQNRSDEPVVEDKNTAEMPSDDIEIRDQPREAEEAAENGGWTEDELDADNTTGEVREPFFDPRDDDPIEVSEGDTEARATRTTGSRRSIATRACTQHRVQSLESSPHT